MKNILLLREKGRNFVQTQNDWPLQKKKGQYRTKHKWIEKTSQKVGGKGILEMNLMCGKPGYDWNYIFKE